MLYLVTAPTAVARQAGESTRELEIRATAVRGMIADGRPSVAEADAEQLFRTVTTGTPATVAAKVGDLLIEAYVRNGRGAEPRIRQLAEQVLRTNSLLLGAASPALSTSLRNLGDVLFDSGEYAAAVGRLREALARDEEALAAPSVLAEDLEHLGRVLTEIEQYDEASLLCDRALALREQSSEEAGLARTLLVRGLVYQRRGQSAAARGDFERAVAIREKLNPRHPETVVALTLWGDQLSIDGDVRRARDVLTDAVARAEATLRPGHPDIAAALRSLGAALQDLGELAESLRLRRRAVDIAEQAFGPSHVLLGVQLNDLANTLMLQGEYSSAQRLYERARSIYRERLGPDHAAVMATSFNLALLQWTIGDLPEARGELERLVRAYDGRSQPNLARALSALAEVLARQGRYREARGAFERALAIRVKLFGPDHWYVATTLAALSETLARLGYVQEAMEHASKSVEIFEKAGSQRHVAEALANRAAITSAAGDDASAANDYERALSIRIPLLGASHPTIAETEVALAGVLARRGDYQQAFTRALRGDEIGTSHSRLTLAYLSERQALDYASSRPKGLDLALSLMASAQEQRRVLNALILGRSLTLDEMGARRRLLLNQSSGTDAPLWTALASARQRLANIVVRGPNDQRPEQYANLVEEARRDKERVERALAERSAAFRLEQAKSEIGLEQVRAGLPPGTALVAFARFERTTPGAVAAAIPSYVAFVLRTGSGEIGVVDLGPANGVDALIDAWRRSMRRAEAERAYRVTGTNLRRRLWDPIAAHLDGASRVFIVPDDAINLVSFAALPVGESRYLVEQGPVIHYLSAERDLLVSEPVPGNTGRGLLAVGDPAFTDASLFAKSRGVTPPVAMTASAALRSASTQCASFQTMQFQRLPGSGTEAQDVAELWSSLLANDDETGSAVVGREASEEAFKRRGPGRRILHLATHGFFLGDECVSALSGTRAVGGLATSSATTVRRQRVPVQQLPENPLLLSGLVLAGANRRALAGPDEDDGILTAEEVASLNLEGVEWTVLSACDTGLGQLRAGEGVFGLRRAFQVAGARTVIMSLWQVEDRSARTWMRALYEARLQRHLDTADSVREAGLTILRDRRQQGRSTHPFFWAGFVAAGDWR